MIQVQTRLNVADNSGAKKLSASRYWGNRRRYARVGDVIVVAVKAALPNGAVKGAVAKAVIVRTTKEYGRKDTYIRFSDNAAVIINDAGEPKELVFLDRLLVSCVRKNLHVSFHLHLKFFND